MECIACSAPLREGARFCHVCGTRQQPALATVSEDAEIPSSDDQAGQEVADVPARRARPPRILRASVEPEDASESQQDVPTASRRSSQTLPIAPKERDIANEWDTRENLAKVDTAATPAAVSEDATATNLTGEDEGTRRAGSHTHAEHAHLLVTVPDAIPNSPQGVVAPAGDGATALPDALPGATPIATSDLRDQGQTQVAEPRAAATPSVAESAPETAAAALDTPDLETTAKAEPEIIDSFPWPLVPGLIVGGRYRIEEVLASSRISREAENTYRATDLRGYERCWSCGLGQGAQNAEERFCSACGADLLGFPLLLRERLGVVTSEGDTQTDDPTTKPVSTEAAAPDASVGEASSTAPGGARYPLIFAQGQREYSVTPLHEPENLFPRGVRLVGALGTDIGVAQTDTHKSNEDSAALLLLGHPVSTGIEALGLAMVADGLGGHANGQEASRLVAHIVTEDLFARVIAPQAGFEPQGASISPGDEGSVVRAALGETVAKANSALCALNAERQIDMGSTLVAALVLGTTAYIIWAGDSRAYSFHEGTLRRLTTDHSLIEQLIVSGMVEPEERYSHPQRNVIFRSLGSDHKLEPEIVVQQVAPGMRLLLCSDGLWEMVHDDEIARILAGAAHPQAAVDQLIAAANANGGEDNISAVVVEVSA